MEIKEMLANEITIAYSLLTDCDTETATLEQMINACLMAETILFRARIKAERSINH